MATAVGATVLTDTAALIVLAGVSGSQLEGGSGASIALQIVLGLTVLLIFTIGLLPRLVRLAFRYLGTDRVVRYLLAVAAFLAAATVADIFGIEPIVGAFFAGLALNRLVPNEGPLMDRIDFFGSAVFVPVFLVSVGMLLDPAVMVEGETLKLAGLFIAASLGGKAIASAFARVALGYSGPQAVLMLGLTIPQAAATLAATIVGYDIGLFDQSVVNAALVLILASIVVGTLLVERSVKAVPPPQAAAERLGARILITLVDAAQAPLGFAIASRIAAPDGGVVHGLLARSRQEAKSSDGDLAQVEAAGFDAGLDAEPKLLVNDSLAEGVVNAATEARASLVLVGQPSVSGASAFGSAGEAVAAALASPVAILVGEATSIREVELIRGHADGVERASEANRLAAELARRLGGGRITVREADTPTHPQALMPGQLCVLPATSWELLAQPVDPPPGAAVLIVPDT